MSFKKCERCGGLWCEEVPFDFLELIAKREYKNIVICPNCTDKLLWFLNHPEDDEEGEE